MAAKLRVMGTVEEQVPGTFGKEAVPLGALEDELVHESLPLEGAWVERYGGWKGAEARGRLAAAAGCAVEGIGAALHLLGQAQQVKAASFFLGLQFAEDGTRPDVEAAKERDDVEVVEIPVEKCSNIKDDVRDPIDKEKGTISYVKDEGCTVDSLERGILFVFGHSSWSRSEAVEKFKELQETSTRRKSRSPPGTPAAGARTRSGARNEKKDDKKWGGDKGWGEDADPRKEGRREVGQQGLG
ncbi:unnamed protein product [Prorocentrum cordatum]|uniref:Uncharacterized protein n=1 Tax=Prorocentrum cordatum TaxID=2364126 RepID=A0ABN9QAJ5_9DINO|nr:unnamed protein product [Polarella glacialis]